MRELERVWFSLNLASSLLAAVGPHLVVGLKDRTLAWFAWATMENLFWVFKAAMVCLMAASCYAIAFVGMKNKYLLGGLLSKFTTKTKADRSN
jgi:hypothetical protein